MTQPTIPLTHEYVAICRYVLCVMSRDGCWQGNTLNCLKPCFLYKTGGSFYYFQGSDILFLFSTTSLLVFSEHENCKSLKLYKPQ